MPPPNIAGMDPEAREELERLLKRARAAKLSVTVRSATRTTAEQAALYARYQAGDPKVPLAAKPGGSRHEKGLAVDLDVPASQRPKFNALAAEHGFKWFGARDRVHYDYQASASPEDQITRQLLARTQPTAPKPKAGPSPEDEITRQLLARTKPQTAPPKPKPSSPEDEITRQLLARTKPTPAPRPPAAARPGALLGDLIEAQRRPQVKSPGAKASPPKSLLGSLIETTRRTKVPSVEAQALATAAPKVQWVSSLSNAYNAFNNELARQIRKYPSEERRKNPAVTGQAMAAALEKARAAFGPEAVNPEHFRILYNQQRGAADRTTYNMLATLDFATSMASDPTNALMGPATKIVGKALSPLTKPLAHSAREIAAGGKAEAALQNAIAAREAAATKLGFIPKRSPSRVSAGIKYGAARKAEQAAAQVVQGQTGAGKLGVAAVRGPGRLLVTLERNARNDLRQEATKFWQGVEKGVSAGKGLVLMRPSSVVADSLGNTGAALMELERQGVNKAAFGLAGKAALKEARAYAQGQAVGDAAELVQHAPEVLGTLQQQVLMSKGAAGKITKGIADNPLARARTDFDRTMKIALYKTLKPKLGGPAAAERVRTALFDYSDRPALLQLADRWGVWIFSGFPVAATKSFIDTLIHRPDLVAKFPRLQKQLLNEFPGSEEAYQQLPSYRRSGGFTYPIGKDESGAHRFIDVGRVSPWAFPMGMAMEAGRMLRGGEMQPPTTQDVSGHGILASIARGVEKAQKTKGAAPEEKWNIAFHEAMLNQLPLARDLQRLRDAWQGKTGSDYKFARPRVWEETVMDFLTGVSAARGETRAEQTQATVPALAGRTPVVAQYFQQLHTALESGAIKNPYVKRFQEQRHVGDLLTAKNEAQQRFTQMLLDPDNVEQGRLTPDGASRIKDSYFRFRALVDRYSAVVQGRR